MALKSNQNKTIVLPIQECNYELFVKDKTYAHKLIKDFYTQMPECFPEEMASGYMLNGQTRTSIK